MAVTTSNLVIDLAQIAGADVATARVTISTNVEGGIVAFPGVDGTRLTWRYIVTRGEATYALPNTNQPTANLTGPFQYIVTIEVPGGPARELRTLPPIYVSMPVGTPTVYLSDCIADSLVPVSWRDGFRANMEDLRNETLSHLDVLTAPAVEQVATYLSGPTVAQSAAQRAAAHAGDPLAMWDARVAKRHIDPAVMVVVGGSTWFGSAATNPSLKVTELFLARVQAVYGSGIAGYEKPQVNVGNGYPTRDTKPGVQLYVSAAGGQTSANYVNATNRPFIQFHRPGLIFHGVGANDALSNPTYNVPIPQYITNVGNAIDTIDAGLSSPAAHVLVHQFRRPGTSVATWNAYRDALYTVAATRPNAVVVDLSEPFERLDVAGADPLDLLDVDGSHLTDAGHAMLADLLAKALRVPTPTGDPKMVLVDTHTRPNGAPGAVEFPQGRNYEPVGTAVATITGQALTLTAAGTVLIESGLSDLEYEALVAIPGSGTSLPGLIFRGQNDTNRMGLFLNRVTGNVMLYKTQAGTTTVLQSVTRVLPAGSYHVKVRAVGDRVWGYVNGVKYIDYTMTADEVTALGSLTKVGIRDNAVLAGVSWTSLRVRRP